MVTMKKLIKTGKTAIIGTVGVGALLSTTHTISADTLKPVDEKVQESQLESVSKEENKKVELQVPDLNKEKQEVEGEKVVEDGNKEKKTEVKNEEKPVVNQEEKPKTDSLQVVNEEKKGEPQMEEPSAPSVIYKKINSSQIIEKSDNENIWTKPHNVEGAESVGSVEDYVGKEVQMSEMALANRKAWFKISVNGKELGWVSSKVMSKATDIESINKFVTIEGTDEKYGIYTLPWGMENSQQVAKVNDYANQDLKATKQTVLNGVVWYKVSQNGNEIGWLDSHVVSEKTVYPHMNVPIESQLDAKDPSRNLETGCEITAVSMMLQYKGANVDKLLLAKEMPYHDYDPNKGYVGDPWSDGPINTIYPPALMELVKKYAGSSVNLTGVSLDKIKEKLNENHPVVTWVGDMHGFGVHAITLTGYEKDKVFYNDPWTGEKDASMSWDSFDNKWTPQKSRAISY